jgi:hypothetical protein
MPGAVAEVDDPGEDSTSSERRFFMGTVTEGPPIAGDELDPESAQPSAQAARDRRRLLDTACVHELDDACDQATRLHLDLHRIDADIDELWSAD